MKVVVSSNCQAAGLGRLFQLMIPDAEVTVVSFPQLLDAAQQPAVVDLYRSADLVLSMDWADRFGVFAASRVRDWLPRVVFVPALEYAGFHPDCTYILLRDGRPLQSPLTDYHSVITAAAFLAGIAPERVPALYNSAVFARLGHFELAESARLACVERFARHGLDLAPLFARWQAGGIFMHSVNHPRIAVLADIARLVCERGGLGRLCAVAYGELVPDELANGPVYPVFPELARRLGVTGGSRVFKVPPSAGVPRERLLELRDFVAAAYAMYRETDRATWKTPARVKEAARILAAYAG